MIKSLRRIGGLAGPIAALTAAALLAAGASAAISSSVTISGPHRVEAGAKVRLHFTGRAAAHVHILRVWLDNRRCATTAKAEAARPELQPPAPPPTQFKVTGRFKARLTVIRSSMGTHVVCAYLLYRASQDTAARASWRYVTR